MIVRLPGAHRPQDDTSLFTEALRCQQVMGSTRVLDLCAGTGALSIAAAKAGVGRVLAVDISRRSIVNVMLNRLPNKARVEARRGDLTAVLTEKCSTSWFQPVVRPVGNRRIAGFRAQERLDRRRWRSCSTRSDDRIDPTSSSQEGLSCCCSPRCATSERPEPCSRNGG
jgi:SAM-dependent methyltransferase